MYYFVKNIKYQCLGCKKVYDKRSLEDLKFRNRYHTLQDYMFMGDFGISKRVVQHWKDTEYYQQAAVAIQEDMCGEMVPLNDDGTLIKCFVCDAPGAQYETACGQSCYKCIWKALEQEDNNVKEPKV